MLKLSNLSLLLFHSVNWLINLPPSSFLLVNKKSEVETFNFVLTEQTGEKRYGYCRRFSGKNPECYSIVSFLFVVFLLLFVFFLIYNIFFLYFNICKKKSVFSVIFKDLGYCWRKEEGEQNRRFLIFTSYLSKTFSSTWFVFPSFRFLLFVSFFLLVFIK